MKKLNACIFTAGESAENAIQFKRIEDKLSTFYDIIKCDCIDIVVREIGGRSYGFIVDDEALLKNEPIVGYLDAENSNFNIYGNMIIVAADPDEEGELIGIEESDYEYVKKYIHELPLRNAPRMVNGQMRDSIAVLIHM